MWNSKVPPFVGGLLCIFGEKENAICISCEVLL